MFISWYLIVCQTTRVVIHAVICQVPEIHLKYLLFLAIESTEKIFHVLFFICVYLPFTVCEEVLAIFFLLSVQLEQDSTDP